MQVLVLMSMALSTSAFMMLNTRMPTLSVKMGLPAGEKMPAEVLKKCGLSGKKGVLFFYGADDAPSCSKELAAFQDEISSFQEAGVSVVGVRNPAGVKGYDGVVSTVVDDDDAMRNEIGIERDIFGLLGGRETYVFDASGTIVQVHNNQFDPVSHVVKAKEGVEKLPKSQPGFSFDLAGLFGQK